jgi:hypothetical protein
VAKLVAVQLSGVLGLYLPPVFKSPPPPSPPQTIIWLPVQTAVCSCRASGALVVMVGVQLSPMGLYLPPVFKPLMLLGVPPQTIISLPVQTAVCFCRASGALVVLVGVQLSPLGSYLPPVFKPGPPRVPPQTIISLPALPVQTAVCRNRASGALVIVVGVQVFVVGSYLPPVFKPLPSNPPQTIIRSPVQTAV